MKTLVLAEKPSVAKEIARVLGCRQNKKNYIEGSSYVVTWALGHLVTLAEPEDYDQKYKTWKLEDLPMMPERMDLKVIRQTSHQFKAISQLAKRSDIGEMIIATDAGREGELVARWIMEKVHWKKPFRRLWISSQTDQAIKEGFQKLRPGRDFDPLFQSAVCRAEADWLIGLNVTRALTTKYNEPLSAGRVQTPTLTMLVQRENEIKNFRSQEYRTLEAFFGGFYGTWRSRNNQDSRIFDFDKASALRKQVTGQQGKVIECKKTDKQEPQPLPYDLTELQRDANKRFGFSAKQTSTVLQRLYERYKLVTYPRTDSRYLTSDMVSTLKSRLSSIAVGPYSEWVKPVLGKSIEAKRAINNGKVTDHHAIIPTEEPLRMSALSSEEQKLYDLIARRFISLFYPPNRYTHMKIVVDVNGEHFYASGKKVTQDGWKKVYGASAQTLDQDDDEKDDAEEREQQLPEVRIGDVLPVKRCDEKEGRTRPPARYTEASLLSQMEKHHLGTPATRDDIIEKLLSSDTIERQNSHLQPTGKGMQLVHLVAEELKSAQLTAKWEQELENISRGKGTAKPFLKGIREQTVKMVQGIKHSIIEYKPHNITDRHCPDCGEPLKEVKRKRGKILICINEDCDYSRSSEKTLLNKRCPQCHKKMELRSGKKGKFAHCRGCNVIEMLDQKIGGPKQKNANQMIKKYSDNTSLGSSLGDALKAALEQKNED